MILILVVIGTVVAGLLLLQSVSPTNMGPPNPCGQVFQGQGRGEFVRCKGFLLTEEGALCSLSAGSCTMTVVNNGTSHPFSVVSTGCEMMLPIMVNGSGTDRSITVTDVEAINGGPAASGVPSASLSGATCWFPTNHFMDNSTTQYVNGCFTFAQVGNLTNDVSLCWSFAKWNLTASPSPPLSCPALLGNLGIAFNTVNATVAKITVINSNSFGVWIAKVNGTSTVGPLGISVTGPYVGDSFAIPMNETVSAKSTTMLSIPGTPNRGQPISYSLSFLPTNESITYTPPCSVDFTGIYSPTSGSS